MPRCRPIDMMQCTIVLGLIHRVAGERRKLCVLSLVAGLAQSAGAYPVGPFDMEYFFNMVDKSPGTYLRN